MGWDGGNTRLLRAINKISLAWHNGFSCLVGLGGQLVPSLACMPEYVMFDFPCSFGVHPAVVWLDAWGPRSLVVCQTRQAAGG